MTNEIKIGFLVSYDYEMLKTSIPLVYDYADKIVLALDKERRTWSGNTIEISDSFFTWIKEIDTHKKIELYEDDFYDSALSVIDNDTRERNMLGMRMGEGGWHIQIDSDEYFLDFNGFLEQLKAIQPTEKVTVQVPLMSVFKKMEDGFLYTKGTLEYCALATNFPTYHNCRASKTNKVLSINNTLVIHESWARDEAELEKKFKNWGHKDDFNVTSFFNLWKALDKYNYRYLRNFHPLSPKTWHSLGFIKGKEITDIFQEADQRFKANELFTLENDCDEPMLFHLLLHKIKRKIKRN